MVLIMGTYDLRPKIEEPWLKSPHFPKKANRHLEYEEIPLDSLVTRRAKEIPDAIGMSFMGVKFTYAQMDKMIDEFAAGLLKSVCMHLPRQLSRLIRIVCLSAYAVTVSWTRHGPVCAAGQYTLNFQGSLV